MSAAMFHSVTRTAIFSAISLGLAVAGCKKAGPSQAAMQRPPAAVTAATAVAQDVPVYLDEIGKTLAIETVSIVPQVSGKVIAAPVENGAWVKKGELLFEIDPRPFEAALAAAKATLAQNKAEWELANIEFRRVQDLIASKAVSQLEYDQRKSDLAVTEARVAAAEAAVQTAQLNLEYTKIYSPIDGRAGARLVDAGNIVKENDREMLILQRLDPIYVEFTITENDLGTVRKYMAAHGIDRGPSPEKSLTVQVDIPGDSQKVIGALGEITGRNATTQPTTARGVGPREGQLTFLDNSVQTGSGTVKLRATVANSDRYFWPGQFVNVRMVLATKQSAVLVPASAQQIGQQGPFVYVVTPENTAVIRPIKPGQRQGDLVVVENGLTPGERVIVAGQLSVQPGGKVIVTNDAPLSQQTAAATH
jgi:multidrug efflux system membrane fusion protein